jgi:CO/xanthine dehydrogenase Mo-binding subunit
MTWLPDSAKNVIVDQKGTGLPKEITVTFNGQPEHVVEWLAASPGTANQIPEIINEIHTYTIKPGGGAHVAEVEVNVRTGDVRILARRP